MELYSVIKNDAPEGDKYAIWKFAGEDFKNGSQLIVNETEEAIFVQDGMIQNIFSPGKYTLNTNNYPFLTGIRSFFSGGISSFHCKVYFIDKSDFMDVKWGTDTPVKVIDPVFGIPTSLQGRGSYILKVSDAKKFYLKFVGNTINVVMKSDVVTNLRGPILQSIKTFIAKYVKESNEELIGISANQEDFAEQIAPKIALSLEDYGMDLKRFFVEALDIPEDDPGRIKLDKARSDAAVMSVMGENWGRQQAADILTNVSLNPGAGGVASAGAGLGMGMAAGGMMGSMAANMFAPMNSNAPQVQQAPQVSSRFAKKSTPSAPSKMVNCSSCNNEIPEGMKFCPNCGEKVVAQSSSYCSCGQEIPSNAKFCPACGEKVELNKKCSNCGEEQHNGSKFCQNCGTKY